MNAHVAITHADGGRRLGLAGIEGTHQVTATPNSLAVVRRVVVRLVKIRFSTAQSFYEGHGFRGCGKNYERTWRGPPLANKPGQTGVTPIGKREGTREVASLCWSFYIFREGESLQ